MTEKIYSLLDLRTCYYCNHNLSLSEHNGADLGCSNKESQFYSLDKIVHLDVCFRGCEKFERNSCPLPKDIIRSLTTDSFLLKKLNVQSESGKNSEQLTQEVKVIMQVFVDEIKGLYKSGSRIVGF